MFCWVVYIAGAFWLGWKKTYVHSRPCTIYYYTLWSVIFKNLSFFDGMARFRRYFRDGTILCCLRICHRNFLIKRIKNCSSCNFYCFWYLQSLCCIVLLAKHFKKLACSILFRLNLLLDQSIRHNLYAAWIPPIFIWKRQIWRSRNHFEKNLEIQ